MMGPGQSKSRHRGQPGPEVSKVLLAELWEAAGGKRHAHRPKRREARCASEPGIVIQTSGLWAVCDSRIYCFPLSHLASILFFVFFFPRPLENLTPNLENKLVFFYSIFQK